MSTDDQTQSDNTEQGLQTPDELSMLKQRARMMGITFSNNIGIEALRAKIEEKMNNGSTEEMPKTDDLGDDNPPPLNDPATPTTTPAGKVLTLRQRIVQENMRLIRLRITNMDPKKKDLPGEVITVANRFLGTVRKYVPYGEQTENGYHVPYCIYKLLKSRKFLSIRTRTQRGNGNQIIVDQIWAPEFALEVLPPLTREELNRLAAAQAAAGGVG